MKCILPSSILIFAALVDTARVYETSHEYTKYFPQPRESPPGTFDLPPPEEKSEIAKMEEMPMIIDELPEMSTMKDMPGPELRVPPPPCKKGLYHEKNKWRPRSDEIATLEEMPTVDMEEMPTVDMEEMPTDDFRPRVPLAFKKGRHRGKTKWKTRSDVPHHAFGYRKSLKSVKVVHMIAAPYSGPDVDPSKDGDDDDNEDDNDDDDDDASSSNDRRRRHHHRHHHRRPKMIGGLLLYTFFCGAIGYLIGKKRSAVSTSSPYVLLTSPAPAPAPAVSASAPTTPFYQQHYTPVPNQ